MNSTGARGPLLTIKSFNAWGCRYSARGVKRKRRMTDMIKMTKRNAFIFGTELFYQGSCFSGSKECTNRKPRGLEACFSQRLNI
jgi:hypothetical protein